MKQILYGANFLSLDQMPELQAALKEKALFRYSKAEPSSCQQFEDLACRTFGATHALVTTSCTQGLRLALLSTRPGIGDRVYVPAVTFIAVVNAVLSCGMIPIPVETDDDLLMDCTKLPHDAKRVIVCHMDGRACDIPAGPEYVIEDCAQALGARNRTGRYVGSIGSCGVFSFQQGKILASGQGGLILTNTAKLFERMRNYHDHGVSRDANGRPSWPEGSYYGENMIANELQASVQLQQMRCLEETMEELEYTYRILLDKLKDIGSFQIRARREFDQKTSLVLYCGSASDRVDLIQRLQDEELPYNTYDRYFIPENPILRDQKSIFRDGFPWNHVTSEGPLWDPGSFARVKERLKRTIAFPIPIGLSLEDCKSLGERYRSCLSAVRPSSSRSLLSTEC